MRKIAVTGGLAAGKTAVCQFLAECGARIVSADAIVHQFLTPQTPLGQQVLNLLGPSILQGQSFDRKKIAACVFAHPETLKALEKLLHPATLDEIKRLYAKALKEGRYPLFVAEVPLLYESESHPFFDAIIAVTADEARCRQRFQGDADTYSRRVERQLPQSEKAALADYTLFNNGSLDELRQNVFTLYPKLLGDYAAR